MNTNINLLTPSHHTALKTKKLSISFFLLVFFMSVFISPKIFSQSDCPGGMGGQRGEIKWWLQESTVSHIQIINAQGVPLSLGQRISVIKGAISSALNQWSGATYGKVNYTEGTSADYNVLITTSSAGVGNPYGTGGPVDINVNASYIWTNDQNSVPTYVDIYSIIIHEMAHVYNVGHGNGNSVTHWDESTVKRNLTPCDITTVQAVYYVNSNIIVQNSFGGGNVKIIDKFGVETSPPSPYTLAELPDTWGWQIKAFDQEFNGERIFKEWLYDNNTKTTTVNPYSIGKLDDTYTANFDLQLTITFQNSFSDGGNGGVIKIDGTPQNSPYQANYNQDDQIIVSPGSNTINGIDFTFSHWGDGSYPATRTFTVTGSNTYTMYLTGKPSNSNRNLYFNDVVGQNVILYWDTNPSPYVTNYKIWRKVKHNGVMGGSVNIATVGSSTISYVDQEYIITYGYTDDLLLYDVRGYYSLDQTYSDPSYLSIFGEQGFIEPIANRGNESELFTNTIKENSIDNYPNPFNPSTIIQYQIKDGGFVSIKVYDYLGREVAVLVNKEQPSGRYSVTFDASKLSSGVYLYTINAKYFHKVKKMILMK